MTTPLKLKPHGPHSADYTRALGNNLAETVRVLNYATGPGNSTDGLPWVIAIYHLTGSLVSATGGFDQLLAQIGGRLERMLADGVLEVRNGQDAGQPERAVARYGAALEAAKQNAQALLFHLQAAHAAASPIGMREDA